MKIRSSLIAFLCVLTQTATAQEPANSLSRAFTALEKDPQLVHGIASLYVVDVKTGAVVYNRNGDIGLAPASAQKVVTAAAALELLGKDFRYQTYFGYLDEIDKGILKGPLLVRGMGDPTLGSDRFAGTKTSVIQRSLMLALEKEGIRRISGGVMGQLSNQEPYNLPRGWIWEDLANYYGAGHGSLNWNENFFDLWLKPSKEQGGMVHARVNNQWRFGPFFAGIRGQRNGAISLYVDSIEHSYPGYGSKAGYYEFRNHITTGPAGSGDQAFVFYNPGDQGFIMTGTIPCCVDSFRIRGAVPDPNRFALEEIARITGAQGGIRWGMVRNATRDFAARTLYVHQSPPLDSIVYWFLQKSINLYGEALLHTIAAEQNGFASYESGLQIVRKFWKDRGIDTAALDIIDGSGLSPQNRVTAKALTQVMRYARSRPWYPEFYAAIPVFNRIKMKSGTIGGVKSYTGYIKHKSGREYAFAIIVNNFTGSVSAVNQKIFAVLNILAD